MPNCSVGSVRERNILNMNPKMRVATEKKVITATTLKIDLILNYLQGFLICLLFNVAKLYKLY